MYFPRSHWKLGPEEGKLASAFMWLAHRSLRETDRIIVVGRCMEHRLLELGFRAIGWFTDTELGRWGMFENCGAAGRLVSQAAWPRRPADGHVFGQSWRGSRDGLLVSNYASTAWHAGSLRDDPG